MGGVLGVAGCGDSGGGTTTTGPATTQERIREDMRAAGQGIRDAATQAAAEVKPALERAKEEGRQAVHDVAVKVAEKTATQPAGGQ